jgi:CheY-like chemotaxis protein
MMPSAMAKILVVDDYRDTAKTTAEWLKLLGYDVQTAHDGGQAIEIARHPATELCPSDDGPF